MSVNTSGGPLPEVQHAASSAHDPAPSASTNIVENPRLKDPVGATSPKNEPPEIAQETRSTTSAASSTAEKKLKWYQYLGRGMYMDVRSRLPYYVSDWTDAWNYRVVPATLVSVEFLHNKDGV